MLLQKPYHHFWFGPAFARGISNFGAVRDRGRPGGSFWHLFIGATTAVASKFSHAIPIQRLKLALSFQLIDLNTKSEIFDYAGVFSGILQMLKTSGFTGLILSDLCHLASWDHWYIIFIKSNSTLFYLSNKHLLQLVCCLGFLK